MLPIVRTQYIKKYSPMTCKTEEFKCNVCLDHNGKEIVWDGIGYKFLMRNGNLSKRYSQAW